MRRQHLLAALCGAFLSTGALAASGDMRAVVLDGGGGPEALRLQRVSVPQAGEGQVRIRVHAAGVNPVDWKIRDEHVDRRAAADTDAPPLKILGFDASGVIDQVGQGVTTWRVGDEVIAALQRAPQGAYAEYAVVPAEDIARKPRKLSFEAAAGLPTVAVTAWRLLEKAPVEKGDRVLVHGGAGGVGSMVVQLAKTRGAHVIATASARNHEYLRSIGVDEPIDYTAVRFEDVLKDLDAVFDTVGPDTTRRSVPTLRKGGVLVSAAAGPPRQACEAAGVRCPPFPPSPDPFGPALEKISVLADAGKLTINVDRVFPLEEAAAAQQLNKEGRTRGKIVLKVREEAT